jgi:hypothetical protein
MMRINFNPWLFGIVSLGTMMLFQISFHCSAIAFSSFVLIGLSHKLRCR